MTYRVKNITIAVVLALVAALLTMFYVTNYQRNVRQDETNVPVCVAKRDIPAGTSGADVSAKGMLEKSEVVRGTSCPARSPTQSRSRTSSRPSRSTPASRSRRAASRLRRSAEIHAQLTGVQRAIASPATSTSCSPARSGGDRVDLVASFE